MPVKAKRIGWDERLTEEQLLDLDPYDYPSDDLEGEYHKIEGKGPDGQRIEVHLVDGQEADPRTIKPVESATNNQQFPPFSSDEKPADCICNFPQQKFRNGSGHGRDCPSHKRFLIKKYGYDPRPTENKEDFNAEDINKHAEPIDEQLWQEIRGIFFAIPRPPTEGYPYQVGTIDNGIKVMLVDGDRVMLEHDMDYVIAGNGEEVHFIPRDEIWIDVNTAPHEWPFSCYHEAVERRHMCYDKMNYEQAHTRANTVEKVLRLRYLNKQGFDVANQSTPTVAGLAVRAYDTGRVLMLQRALDESDPASGKWEFPGGHLEDDEEPIDGAKREWHEEVGLSLPPGKINGQWVGSNGIYQGFVYEIPYEELLDLNDRNLSLNPDGDRFEAVAWVNPEHFYDHSLRHELLDDSGRVRHALDSKG